MDQKIRVEVFVSHWVDSQLNDNDAIDQFMDIIPELIRQKVVESNLRNNFSLTRNDIDGKTKVTFGMSGPIDRNIFIEMMMMGYNAGRTSTQS